MIGFVVNPVSGNGRGAKVWRELENVLQERGISYQVKLTMESGEAKQLASQLVIAGARLVVAVGGDGTVNEVINGLYEADGHCLFGHIATGSGNDFARAYGISRNPREALETILAGRQVMAIDLLRINDRVAANAVGAGFDGQVAKTTNEAAYKKLCNRLKLGFLAYIVSVLRVLLSYRPSRVTIRVDGREETIDQVWLIAVSNIPNYGGGMLINPHALADDGIAEVCVVSNVGRWELLRAFPLIFSGAHVNHPAVRFLRGRRIEISSQHPLIVHADGEVVATTPLVIEVVPHRQQVLHNRQTVS